MRPKPKGGGQREKIEEIAVYETDIEYLNGDTETVRHYGKSNEWELGVGYDSKVVGKQSSYQPSATHVRNNPLEASDVDIRTQSEWNNDDYTFHYQVLAREPITEKVGSETWKATWTVEWQYKKPKYNVIRKRWLPEVTDINVEKIE